MASGLKATCVCNYEAMSIIGSSRAENGKVFDFPHYCNDCQSVTRADLLSFAPCCNECGSTNITSYETSTRRTPFSLLEKLGSKFLRNRGYHLLRDEVESTYCPHLEKTFVMLKEHNSCPKCKNKSLTFHSYIKLD